MSLIRGTATFTQGSKSVSVVAGGNTQYFDSNTLIFVDGDPARVVAASSGSPTSFLLVDNWSDDTVTTTFTAWDTIEGLYDSVQTARAFKQQLEDANAIVASIANLFGTIGEGIAGTASGEYFSVVGTGEVALTLYLNNANVAVEQSQLASNSGLATAVFDAIAARDAAASSASDASGSADSAATSAGAATTQAGIATDAASAASTSEDNAANSANTASAASSNAVSAANTATGALASFEDVYLGDLAADPAVIDSELGQLYTNTVSGKLRYFDGTNWTNSTPDGDYLLL